MSEPLNPLTWSLERPRPQSPHVRRLEHRVVAAEPHPSHVAPSLYTAGGRLRKTNTGAAPCYHCWAVVDAGRGILDGNKATGLTVLHAAGCP